MQIARQVVAVSIRFDTLHVGHPTLKEIGIMTVNYGNLFRGCVTFRFPKITVFWLPVGTLRKGSEGGVHDFYEKILDAHLL